MIRKRWAVRAKLLAETAAVICFAMCLSSNARADYSYTFSLNPTGFSLLSPVSGSFTTSALLTANGSIAVKSYNYSYTYAGITYSGSSASSSGSGLSIFGSVVGVPLNLGSAGLSIYSANALAVNGHQVTGNVTVSERVSLGLTSVNVSGSGFFEALLTSSPGAGGGGGGGGGSGGAPSPEVNAGLGMILAGATFAFLRRRRGHRLSIAAL